MPEQPATAPINNDPHFDRMLELASFEIRAPRSHRGVEILRQNETLVSPQLRDLLLSFARGDAVFPANFWPYEGRSLYGQFSNAGAQAFGIDALKMKGGAGLVRDEDAQAKPRIELPKPEQTFSVVQEPHLSLAADFTPSIKMGRPKGLNSLTARQAEREYDAHELLSRENLTLRPLMAVAFTVDGKPELDLNGDPTGCVFLESCAEHTMLGRLAGFDIRHRPGDFNSNELSISSEAGFKDFREAIYTHNRLIEMAAASKRDAVEAAGLTRHVGHLDNFLADRRSRRILLSDLDSAGLLKIDTADHERAAACIVRDVASDTLRTVMNLSLHCFSGAFFKLGVREYKDFNFFLPYLKGFFGRDVSETVVQKAAENLQAGFLEYQDKRIDALMEIHDMSYALAAQGRNRFMPEIGLNWKMEHLEFTGNMLRAIFPLYQLSTLANTYPIPANVQPGLVLNERFESSGRLLLEALIAEARAYNVRCAGKTPLV